MHSQYLNHRNNKLHSQYLDSQQQQASFTGVGLITTGFIHNICTTAAIGVVHSIWAHNNRMHSQYLNHRNNKLHSQYLDSQQQQASFTGVGLITTGFIHNI
jgi:hypothetical protein